MSVAQSLRKQAQLVAYERNQMHNSEVHLRYLAQERAEADEDSAAWAARFPFWQTENNAALESFLIHFRNLQHFLSPEGIIKDTDVTVGRFLDQTDDYCLPDVPTATRKAINWRLAHITTHRLAVKQEDKGWPATDMAQEMEAAWLSFLKTLQTTNPERLEWFKTPTSQDRVAAPPPLLTPMATASIVSITTASTESVPAIGTDVWIARPFPDVEP